MTELERLPNGSFVAAPQTEVSVESTSPRTKRAAKPKENADEKSLENTLTPGIELKIFKLFVRLLNNNKKRLKTLLLHSTHRKVKFGLCSCLLCK